MRFHVALVGTALFTAAGSRAAPPAAPLSIAADEPVAVGYVLAGGDELLAALRPVDRAEVALPLTPQIAVTLELERVRVFAADAELFAADGAGGANVVTPDAQYFRGAVAGDPTSRVFLALAPGDLQGWLSVGGSQYVIATPADGSAPPVVYDMLDFPVDLWDPASFACQVIEAADGAPPAIDAESFLPPACRIARLAMETDHEFRQAFPGNKKAMNYIGTLIGAMNEIYGPAVNLRFEVGYARLWTDPGDPWTQTSTSAQLSQFRSYWQSNMQSVDRALAHFLSGRGLGGGVAYLPGLCNGSSAYGLSANLSGFFPYPLQLDGHWQNWDIVVVSHEIGHNSGAPHTHSMSPRIDNCAGGQCGDANLGTIMSYCHTCGGGMNNINLYFHQRIIDERMIPYINGINAGCGLENVTPSIVNAPVDTEFCVGGQARLTVDAAGGTIFAYQWRRAGVDLPGETDRVLNLPAAQVADAGSYDVVVSNECGASVTSPAAVLSYCWSPGDVNADCASDLNDLLVVLANFGAAPAERQEGDLDGNGSVGLEDVLLLLGAFGAGDCTG